MAALVLFRGVRRDPPTADDFRSNAARGRAPRRVEREHPELWTGLSLFDTADAVRARARLYPAVGRFVAAVRVSDVADATVRPTLGAGHYTVWAEAEALLDAVIGVVPI